MTNRFQPNGLGLTIFNERYAQENETWEDACHRVAGAISNAENIENKSIWYHRFFNQLIDGKLMPGGRIMNGAGLPRQSMLNCVSGETEVRTSKGIFRAKDLVGTSVEVLTGDGTYREAEWHSFGKQELYKITFKNGNIIYATAKHEWIVNKPKGGKERVITTNLLGRNVPLIHNNDHIDNKEIFKEGVQHGLIFGDGTLIQQGKKSALLQFGDSRHLVYDYCESYSTQYHARYQEGVAYSGNYPPEYKYTLPDVSEDKSYIRGFIAGMIAADGCVDSRGVVMLHSSSKDVLQHIQSLSNAVGLIVSSIKLDRSKSPFNETNAPLYKLIFIKQSIDGNLILKENHKYNWNRSSYPSKCPSNKVVKVEATDIFEEVFCCIEPITNSWVTGDGILTSNCFVVPTNDSIEGWAETEGNTMIISSRGGGVGTNYSPLRGRGYPIGGMGGTSTGAVSLMYVVNSTGKVIKDGAGRRTALMMCLDINHPDIEEFLDAKLKDGELKNANISVVLPPELSAEDFAKLVRTDGEIELRFGGLPDKMGRTIKARELWNRLVKNAWFNGEPGILNGHLANKMSNVYYHWPLISTNPCGEIWLPAYGCCDLGALVLPRFIEDGDINWDALDESVRIGVRFLDNVLDVNHYPIPEIEKVCKEERRVGLGVMGLHSMLLDLGFKYNDSKAYELVDKLFSFIKNTAYDASVTLSAEKGAFPAYHPDFLKSGFAKTLKRGIRNKIKMHGIRNCAMLTIAPTGTTSMVQGVTGGIEPVFSPVYIRRRLVSDEKQHETITETLVISQEYMDHPKNVQGAYDIHPRDHIKMQVIAQKHIDNAVSKTINLKEDFPIDELGDLWLDNLGQMKGSTFYREGSRETKDSFEPMKHIPVEEMDNTIANWSGEIEYELPDSMDCASGVCEIE